MAERADQRNILRGESAQTKQQAIEAGQAGETGLAAIFAAQGLDPLVALEERLKGGLFSRIFNPRIGGEFGPRLANIFTRTTGELPSAGGRFRSDPEQDELVNEIIKLRTAKSLVERGLDPREFNIDVDPAVFTSQTEQTLQEVR